MKIFLLTCLLAAFLVVESTHTFLGTNVNRPLMYHNHAQFSSKVFRKRVENINFVMPNVQSNNGRFIQGILAVDLTNSEASANITQGGLGFNFVNIRMKSERGKSLNYDIYIYA